MPAPVSPIAMTMSRTSSSEPMRLATKRSSEVRWLGLREVEKPRAPACTASFTAAFIFSMSSSLASSSNARSPMT